MQLCKMGIWPSMVNDLADSASAWFGDDDYVCYF